MFLVYERAVFDDPRASAGARSATDCTVRERDGARAAGRGAGAEERPSPGMGCRSRSRLHARRGHRRSSAPWRGGPPRCSMELRASCPASDLVQRHCIAVHHRDRPTSGRTRRAPRRPRLPPRVARSARRVVPGAAGSSGFRQDDGRCPSHRRAGRAAAGASALWRSRTRSSSTSSTVSWRRAPPADRVGKNPKVRRRSSFLHRRQEQRAHVHAPARRRVRRRRQRLGLHERGPRSEGQPRPVGDRRGRAVRARERDRGLPGREEPAAARRPPAAAAGESGRASRRRRFVRARLVARRRRGAARAVRVLPRPDVADASGVDEGGLGPELCGRADRARPHQAP